MPIERDHGHARGAPHRSNYTLSVRTFLLALVGSFLGAALGLFLPPLVLVLTIDGGGSYEDVLSIWLATLPAGFALGAWCGHRLGRYLERRRRERDAVAASA